MTTKPVPFGRIELKNVRLSFPGLFKAESFKPGDEPKFKATFLVPKGSPLAQAIDAKILEVIKAKYPQKGDALLKSIRNNPNKFCWQDGDTKAYDGYEGMMALSAKNSVRPTVVDRNGVTLTESEGKPYAGCYVNAKVDLFTYDSSGVGVSASLGGVQFVKDGESFGGAVRVSAEEFENLGDDEDMY